MNMHLLMHKHEWHTCKYVSRMTFKDSHKVTLTGAVTVHLLDLVS